MLDEKAIQDPAFATDDSDLSHDDGDSSIFGDAGSDQGSKAAVPCEFLCGVAGSGKTFELKRRIEADPSYGLLMATTGVAAVNLGTVTIHSTLGYFKTEHMAENYSTGRLQARIRRIIQEKGVRNFCVDEISMMPAEQLDYLHQAISEVNGYKTTRTPIGIVACGDFCLGVGTKVTMANGTLRAVEDIRVGEQVMGPDSLPRNVLQTTRGTDDLFLVAQTNGEDYVVNSNHLLSLIRGRDGRGQAWAATEKVTGIRYPADGDGMLISAPELLKKSGKFRKCFVGHKAGVIALPPRPVQIDPYYLGLWLGDGDKDGPRITSMDSEVLEYCGAYAQRLGLQTKTTGWPERTKAVRMSITGGQYSGVANPVRTALRTYGLLGNKHIPEDYLLNSVEVRLQLLAGLLDSDGSWSGNRFTVTLTVKMLAEQLKQLVDQLGFRTAIQPMTSGWYKNGANGGAWVVTIGGDTWRIPTKIQRKISPPRSLGRSRMTSTLEIVPYGRGEYAGFEIDGDHLFLLADGTVTHNCQLSPIKAKWAFEAECWPDFQKNVKKLTKIWRQSDDSFLRVLNFLRIGDGKSACELIQGMTKFAWNRDDNYDGTTCLTTNDEVERHNFRMLMQTQGKPIVTESRRWGQVSGDWRLIPEKLGLKVGCLVMILANDSPKFSYANGDTGHVESFDGRYFTIKLVRNGQLVRIGRIYRTHQVKEPPIGVDPESCPRIGEGDEIPFGEVSYDSERKAFHVGGIEYFPIRVAYGATVHKLQGVSLDRIQFDFRHRFAGNPASMYVAISRCRTPQGLRLIGSEKQFIERVKVDPKVIPWL